MRPVLLLVEDDAMVARAVTRAVTRSCDVRHASTHAEALVLVGEGGYGILLCDWDLGYQTGADILELSWRIHPKARRVVYSARPVDELRAIVVEGQADEVVEKPFDVHRLVALLVARVE